MKIEQRLTLFYLANDVIQHSKRKNYEFVESWGTSLQRATTLVREDERIKAKILRVFKIWEQRSVYNEEFLTGLYDLLKIAQTPKKLSATSSEISPAKEVISTGSQDNDDFQLTSLVSSIRNTIKYKSISEINLNIVSKTSTPDVDHVKNTLKGN